jgi:hypothetical protein
MSMERSRVDLNGGSSADGKRWGSMRFVSEAMPTGMSGSASRTARASRRARSTRVAEATVADASMERDVSITTYASAPCRT